MADPIDPGRQYLFDIGSVVGELARGRYPSGVLIKENHFEHFQAVKSTKALLARASIDTLFEPAFSFESVRTRIDILNPIGGREYELIEVKSNTSVKAEHIADIAIQLHVLEGSGVDVGRASLMHINNSYVYQGGPLDLNQFFSLGEVTAEVRQFTLNELPHALNSMWEMLKQGVEPAVETGPHCKIPYQCPFYGNCHPNETNYPVEELPRVNWMALSELRKLGIRDISEIPADFPGLTARQAQVRESVITGKPVVSPDFASRLQDVGSPVTFMDFETLNPAIPKYIGTKPYETIPFQWSIHIQDELGQLSQKSFLNEGADDPREMFIKELLDTVPREGTIVVYSGYEQTVMRQLAISFPQYADPIEDLCARTFDLLKLIRESYYHPEFHGDNSLKSVLPTLVPNLSYADLGIQDGSMAAVAYAKMIGVDTSLSDRARIREDLLAYCKRDTEAMVLVFEALLQASGE